MRKSQKEKILTGTFRKDRNPAKEPNIAPAKNSKRPPILLNKFGRKFWKETVEELVDSGVLTEVDWTTFSLCCESYGMFREAWETLYHPVNPDTGKKGKRTLAEYLDGRNTQTSMKLTTMNKAKEQFLKYANVLGLHPVTRNHLNVLSPEEKNSIQWRRCDMKYTDPKWLCVLVLLLSMICSFQ